MKKNGDLLVLRVRVPPGVPGEGDSGENEEGQTEMSAPVEDEVCIWRRQDYGVKCFLTTLSTGPDWESVVWRVTSDLDTGNVVEEDGPEGQTDKE